MANPGIEVAWGGGGSWRRHWRRSVKPYAECAVELASGLMEEMDISYSIPKRATIWRCGRSFPLAGAAIDEREIELFFRHDHIKHHKIAANIEEFAITAFHETLHAVRAERYNDYSLTEFIASEGLSYVGEDLANERLLLPQERGFFGNCINIEPSPVMTDLKQLVSEHHRDSVGDDVLVGHAIDAWLPDPDNQLTPGLVVGITEVYRRITEGVELSELLDWPADQILDLCAA